MAFLFNKVSKKSVTVYRQKKCRKNPCDMCKTADSCIIMPPSALLSEKNPDVSCQLFLQIDQPLGDVLGNLIRRLVLVQIAVE